MDMNYLDIEHFDMEMPDKISVVASIASDAALLACEEKTIIISSPVIKKTEITTIENVEFSRTSGSGLF